MSFFQPRPQKDAKNRLLFSLSTFEVLAEVTFVEDRGLQGTTGKSVWTTSAGVAVALEDVADVACRAAADVALSVKITKKLS